MSASVDRPEVLETTALGAAWLAGQREGVYTDMEEFSTTWALERKFEPTMDEETRALCSPRWGRAVRAMLAV